MKKPQQVISYRTSDGQMFSSETKAEDHEFNIQQRKVDVAFDYIVAITEQHRPSGDDPIVQGENQAIAWHILYSSRVKHMLIDLDHEHVKMDTDDREYYDELESDLADKVNMGK